MVLITLDVHRVRLSVVGLALSHRQCGVICSGVLLTPSLTEPLHSFGILAAELPKPEGSRLFMFARTMDRLWHQTVPDIMSLAEEAGAFQFGFPAESAAS
jgi:hypothetical protein